VALAWLCEPVKMVMLPVGRAPHAARVSAANSLLDRGYGRPAQSVDVSAMVTTTIARESARDIIARRLASIAERLEAERDSQRLN
jgi:hypothetical protein